MRWSLKKCLASILAIFCVPMWLSAAGPAEWVSRTVAYSRCVGTGGNANANTSGTGTDFIHNLSCQLDAGMLKANGVVTACALMTIATGSTAPQLQMKLKACTVSGCATGVTTQLVTQGVFSPTNSATTNEWVCTKSVARTAPSATTQTDSSFLTTPGAMTNVADTNSLAQPIQLNTSVPQFWSWSSQWAAGGTGTSTATLNTFEVKVTN